MTKFAEKIGGKRVGGGGWGVEILACKLQVWLYIRLNYFRMFLDNFAALEAIFQYYQD